MFNVRAKRARESEKLLDDCQPLKPFSIETLKAECSLDTGFSGSASKNLVPTDSIPLSK